MIQYHTSFGVAYLALQASTAISDLLKTSGGGCEFLPTNSVGLKESNSTERTSMRSQLRCDPDTGVIIITGDTNSLQRIDKDLTKVVHSWASSSLPA